MSTEARPPAPPWWELSPGEVAAHAPRVRAAYGYLWRQAGSLADPSLRRWARTLLRGPALAIQTRLPAARVAPAGPGLAATVPQAFLSAPGGAPRGHHSYPGGLPVHVAGVLRQALARLRAWRQSDGVSSRRDVVIAAALLHDCAKPWVFHWETGGRLRSLEVPLAGCGSHHALGVAEGMLQGLPREVVLTAACAHVPPKETDALAALLAAAANLAGTAPQAAPPALEEEAGALFLEGWALHFADGDHPLTEWACARAGEALHTLWEAAYGAAGPGWEAFRNFALAHLGEVGVCGLLAEGGPAALRGRLGELGLLPDRPPARGARGR